MTTLRSPPQSLPSACLAAANRLASAFDRFVPSGSGEAPPPLFVLGLPRSGTTLLYELLVQAFEVGYVTRLYSYTYGLPKLTTWAIAPLTKSPRARFRSELGRIPGYLAPAENHVIWRRWFLENGDLGHFMPPQLMAKKNAAAADATARSLARIAGRPYVFKDVYLTMSPATLLGTFPDSRVVTVKRPLDAVAASLYRAHRRAAGRRWWSVRPPFYNEYLDRPLVERVAFQCVRTQQLMERELRRADGDRCMSVSYAEVCRSPRDFISRMTSWAGNLLEHRAGAEIPSTFVERGPAALPEEVQRPLSEHISRLEETGREYLARVEQRVADRQSAR